MKLFSKYYEIWRTHTPTSILLMMKHKNCNSQYSAINCVKYEITLFFRSLFVTYPVKKDNGILCPEECLSGINCYGDTMKKLQRRVCRSDEKRIIHVIKFLKKKTRSTHTCSVNDRMGCKSSWKECVHDKIKY